MFNEDPAKVGGFLGCRVGWLVGWLVEKDNLFFVF